jgi:PAS domain S-box-containing protein
MPSHQNTAGIRAPISFCLQAAVDPLLVLDYEAQYVGANSEFQKTSPETQGKAAIAPRTIRKLRALFQKHIKQPANDIFKEKIPVCWEEDVLNKSFPKATVRPLKIDHLWFFLLYFSQRGYIDPLSNDINLHFTESLDLICIANTEGFFVKINPAFSSILGYSREELLSVPFVEFIHPDDVEATQEEIVKLSLGEPTISFVNRYRDKSGQYHYLQWKAKPDTDKGLIYAIARDMTENIRLQNELKKLSLVASHTDSGVIITDRDGYIEWINEGFEHLTGYSMEECVGKKPGDLLQGSGTDAETVDRIRTKLAQGISFTAEILNYHKNKKAYWIEMNISPRFNEEGELTNFIAIEKDITDKMERLAEIKKINKDLDEFAYIVSHDLKAPLRAIGSLTDWLVTDYTDKLDNK